MLKKAIISSFLFVTVLLTCLVFQHSTQTVEESKNIFATPIFTHYRTQIKNFLSNHPLYDQLKSSSASRDDILVNAVVEEIEKIPHDSDDQRASHESFVKKMRDAIKLKKAYQNEDLVSNKIFEDLINCLYLQVNINADIQSFLSSYVKVNERDFFNHLMDAQRKLRGHPHFYGVVNEASTEDQFFHGNLPSLVAIINDKVKLIRIGQPICQASRAFWWISAPKVSPEFLFFLQNQPRHFYVNLMKRKGVEEPLTHTLETLENRCENLFLITLDKNSSFYWQKEQDYPEVLESENFKQIFLNKMCSRKGNYFWSKHLNLDRWKEELRQILDNTHHSIFLNKDSLDRKERQDFIELTYVGIINNLVAKWSPTSMNITCRQGIDRGPSLAALWMYQKNELNNNELSTMLLATPLIIRNRASHTSRLERFISAAKRIEDSRISSNNDNLNFEL